jgi:hypothetical protein
MNEWFKEHRYSLKILSMQKDEYGTYYPIGICDGAGCYYYFLFPSNMDSYNILMAQDTIIFYALMCGKISKMSYEDYVKMMGGKEDQKGYIKARKLGGSFIEFLGEDNFIELLKINANDT